MVYKKRIAIELAKFQKSPNSSCIFIDSDFKTGNDYIILSARILGPEKTPYHNGVFHLEIYVPKKYPFCPPSIKFITKIYHPNIDDAGRICLDLLKMAPAGTWRPSISLEDLLIAITVLMGSPNPDDPLMADIAREYKLNRDVFDEKARQYTELHAKIKT